MSEKTNAELLEDAGYDFGLNADRLGAMLELLRRHDVALDELRTSAHVHRVLDGRDYGVVAAIGGIRLGVKVPDAPARPAPAEGFRAWWLSWIDWWNHRNAMGDQDTRQPLERAADAAWNASAAAERERIARMFDDLEAFGGTMYPSAVAKRIRAMT